MLVGLRQGWPTPWAASRPRLPAPRPRADPKPSEKRPDFPFDITAPVWQHRDLMSETEKQISLTRAASMNRRGAKSKFLSILSPQKCHMTPKPYRYATKPLMKTTTHLLGAVSAALCAFSGLASLHADPLDHWHWLYPSSTANRLTSLCAGAGAFVAVGDYGTILRSSDGRTWSSVGSASLDNLWGVTFGNGIFVAVGDAGTILTSTNSIDWVASQGSGLTTEPLIAVSFGGGLFAACPQDGTVLLSTNGVDWTLERAGITFESIVYGDGVFVAYNGASLYDSSNGATWQSASVVGAPGIYGGLLFYANGYFATSTANIVSTNGIIWSAQNIPPMDTFLAYADGQFVIPASGFTWTSKDFSGWSSHPSNLAHVEGGVGGYAAGVFVIYGFLANESSPSHLLYSTNALDWYSADLDSRNYLYAVDYYQGAIIAGGAGGVLLVSTNGHTWTKPVAPQVGDIGGFGVGDGIVVAGVIDGQNLVSLVSTNLTDWTSSVAAPIGGWPQFAFHNGTFVGAEGYMIASTNGVQWQLGSYTPGVAAEFSSVAFGNGLFVAVGGYPQPVLASSTDGLEWQAHDPQSPEPLRTVAYGNGTWLVVGDQGTVVTSPDGTNWSATSFLPTVPVSPRFLIFHNGLFVMLASPNLVLTSSDGFTWTNHSVPTDASISAMAFAGNSLVVVGQGGAILQSDSFPPPSIVLGGGTVLPTGGFQFTASGGMGCTISFQASTNLVDWVSLTNVSVTTATVQLTDPAASNHGQRFYRAVLQ